MNSLKLPTVIAALALVACGPATNNQPTDTGSGNDAAVTMPDSGGNDAAAAPVGVRPPANANYCTMEGCYFRPVSLPSCDDGAGEYEFYNQDFERASVTLLVVAAGWCRPCQIEAPMIESLITTQYEGRVRVISVYGQNPDYSPPTINHCNNWRRTYSLTSHMVLDPMGRTQVYFPNMAFPANIVIDNRGRIRARLYGTSSGLGTLRAAIEEVLAEQGH